MRKWRSGRRHHLLCNLAALLLAVTTWTAPAAATTCEEFDECTINGMCQPDGSCVGTPRPDDEACNDGNVCTINDRCQSGTCAGTADPEKLNQPCDLGFPSPCFLNPTCKDIDPGPGVTAFCIPTVKTCEQDQDKCTTEACSVVTGDCASFPVNCTFPCSAGSCDAATGNCISVTPRPNGFSCSDANPCTTTEGCQNGACVTPGGGGPTATQTRTPTAGGATPTRTPTRTATRTETVAACLGDCDGNGVVDGADLVRLNSTINRCPCAGGTPGGAAAGCAAVPNGCPAADFNSDGCLRAGEVSRVVKNVIGGVCAGIQGTAFRRSISVLQSTTSAFLVLPRIVAAILGPVSQFSGGSGATVFINHPFQCPTSGGGTLVCEQEVGSGFPPTFSAPVYTITFNSCKATTATGRTVTFGGAITSTGEAGDICGIVSPQLQVATETLVVDEVGTAGSATASFTNFNALVNLAGSDVDCQYNSVTMSPTGNVSVETKLPGGMPLTSTQTTYGLGSMIDLSVFEYGAECVPVQYVMQVDGDITLTSSGNSLAATFEQYTLTNDLTDGSDRLQIDGALASACFAAPVTFFTEEAMVIAGSSPCPREGRVGVSHELANAAIVYGASNVGIDVDDDGSVEETFASCLDPAFNACP